MDKRFTLIFLLFISSCSNKQTRTSCYLNMGDSSVELTLSAKYDDLLSLHVKEFLELPYSYVLDEKIVEQLKRQMDENSRFEDNVIVKEYDIEPDIRCSLSKTKEFLMENLYVCR